jgi:molybdopterin converting factor small subunit
MEKIEELKSHATVLEENNVIGILPMVSFR